MNIIIRDLQKHEIWAAADIVKELWGKEPAEKVVCEMADMFGPSVFPPHYFVAEDSNTGEIIGFTGLRDCFILTHAFECIWINVKHEYQGKGIGKLLNDARIKKFKEMGGRVLWVMTKNLKFFGAAGFKTIRVYDDGWNLMELKVGEVKL